MKKIFVSSINILLVSFFLISCGAADEAMQEAGIYDLAYVELFDTEPLEWSGGIADYPDSLEGQLNFSIVNIALNGAFTGDNNVLRISAKNPHKDLFYYITRKFQGLEPNANYKISFTYEFLVEVLDVDATVFASDLYLKAGGTLEKPDVTVDADYYGPGANNILLNYDKGEGELNGNSTIYYIRHIQEPISHGDPILVQGETTEDIIVQTNSNGEFWGIFGIDSKNDKELSFAFNTIIVFFKRL